MKVLSNKLMLAFPDEPTVWCPGCNIYHRFNVNRPNESTGARWTWNGNAEKPTFSPSLVIEHSGIRCHSFLKDGVWQFLSDCTHSLTGQNIPLPDLPEDDLEDR